VIPLIYITETEKQIKGEIKRQLHNVSIYNLCDYFQQDKYTLDKIEGPIGIDNPEAFTTLDKQDPGRRQTQKS